MEDSAIVEHQNRRKRSFDNNAFAKFVPLASPLGDVDDGAFQDPNPEDHDNGHKRHKRNSDALLTESAYISSFSSSSSFLKQSVASDNNLLAPKKDINLQFSSPSNSTKHSSDTRTSPSSIASKFNMQYEDLDAKCSQSLSSDQIDVGSVGSMASEQLSKRPKVGEIYKTIEVHRESTVKRLKDLCNKEPTIDVGVEMADAASLLKLMSFSTNEIESAGQKAQRGAVMLLQAEILRKNGLKLLYECQNLLKDTLQ